MPTGQPTTVVITFSGTGSPQTVNIPAGIDFRQTLKNIFLAGGFWFLSSTGVETFCPASQITSAIAQ
jgi:hypothetical protein